MNSIKNFLLELESEIDTNFVYLKSDTIRKIVNVEYKADKIDISFMTTYSGDKVYTISANKKDFKKWMSAHLEEKNKFLAYLKDFFENSKEVPAEMEVGLNEIIDDTNEIMPDQDIPSNATNRMVGADQTMDAEKIFKRSMPKSIRNYSGNLGLGTVTW